jgi:ABC-2 type transport system ATP-binding protein
MIEISNIKKNYQNFRLECSLNIAPGRITGIIGANGAGKSTLFKAILGLINLDEGQIKIFGKDSRKLDVHDKEKLGVVLAESGFSEYLKVKALVPILKNMYPAFDEGWFQKKCEEFHLPMDKKLKDFSTGMKAKLKVLSAVANGDARLLILDEPTAGMDVMVREQILDLLREFMMPGDRSILISSHISSDLEGFCDDVYLMNQGKIILHEDVDTLLEQYGILKVTTEQYDTLDKEYLLRVKKEDYGYACLTGQRDFYQENWPQIIVEKGTIDQIMTMMVEGK